MRLEMNSSPVVGPLGHKVIDFSVSDPKVIFKLLTESLYKDPFKTAIQEYLVNARDAHREVGTTRPIEVSVSTSAISIRDYGPGLSPARVEEVFVKLGASTKRHSNEFTGGFGVGAKSAFAYTDSFVIRTWVDGVEYEYLLYREDLPRMRLIKRHRSSESNGVEVILPLNESLSETLLVVHRTVAFWSEPVLVNGKPVEPPKIVFEDERGVVFENAYGLKGLYALVDGVPYGIPREAFDGYELPFSTLPDYYVKHSVGLKFSVADVKLVVSREALIFDEDFILRTVVILKRLFSKIVQQVPHEVIGCMAVVPKGIEIPPRWEISFRDRCVRSKVPEFTAFRVYEHSVRNVGKGATLPFGARVILAPLTKEKRYALRRKYRGKLIYVVDPKVWNTLAKFQHYFESVKLDDLRAEEDRPVRVMLLGQDGYFYGRSLEDVFDELKSEEVVWVSQTDSRLKGIPFLVQLGLQPKLMVKCSKKVCNLLVTKGIKITSFDDFLERIRPVVLSKCLEVSGRIPLSRHFQIKEFLEKDCYFALSLGPAKTIHYSNLEFLYPELSQVGRWFSERARWHKYFGDYLSSVYYHVDTALQHFRFYCKDLKKLENLYKVCESIILEALL